MTLIHFSTFYVFAGMFSTAIIWNIKYICFVKFVPKCIINVLYFGKGIIHFWTYDTFFKKHIVISKMYHVFEPDNTYIGNFKTQMCYSFNQGKETYINIFAARANLWLFVCYLQISNSSIILTTVYCTYLFLRGTVSHPVLHVVLPM